MVYRKYMIDYKLSSDTWDNREIEAINRVIASNRYTMGHEVRKFEEEFAEFLGVKHAIMTNSGSSANLLALTTLSLHPKFKKVKQPNVIVPAVSWSTTFFPIHQNGFQLKFVDVDASDYNINFQQVFDAVDENTVAIMAVNLLGSAAAVHTMRKFCDQKGITLIEDNCESFGATLFKKNLGTYGHMGTFSFFFSHHLQTMEGGMVVTDDDDLVDYLRSLRAHGWVRDIEGDQLYQKTGDPFEDSFRFVLPGYCVRPLEFSGAVGQEQLKKWPEMIEARRKNGVVAQNVFDYPEIRLQTERGLSSWFGFGLTLHGSLKGRRKEVIQMLSSLNVETRPIVAGNFMRNPVIKHMNCLTCEAPNADHIHDNGFFIGNDCIDLEEKIVNVATVIEKMIK